MIINILITIAIVCIVFTVITFLIIVTTEVVDMWFYTIPASIIMLCLATAGLIEIWG